MSLSVRTGAADSSSRCLFHLPPITRRRLYMNMHPQIIDAIVSLLKQDVTNFYTKRPAIELRNPHLELFTALSKRGIPPVLVLLDRIEIEADPLADELEAQGRNVVRHHSSHHNKAKPSDNDRIVHGPGQHHT